MGLIAGIKALLAINKIVSEIKGDYKMNTTPLKPGWQTTEFWSKVVVDLFTLWAAVKGLLPAQTALIISASLNGVYALARNIAKAKNQNTTLPDVTA